MSGQAAVCDLCGASFAPHGRGGGAFCRRCAARADREAGRPLRMDCKACGKRFSPPRRNIRYCSDACRAEGARRRSRESQRRYVADPEKRAINAARNRVAAAARRALKRGGGPPTRRPALLRADPNAEPSVCGLCGRRFAQYGRSSRHGYCKRCTARADREVGRTLRAKCAECGGRFSTTSRAIRYCSDECRAEGLRRSQRKSDRRRKADPRKRALAEARKRALNAARRGGVAR